MKKSYCLIILSLLFSLFVYLFYRTEKTVVNEIFISVFSPGTLAALKKSVTGAFPLNGYIIYSLPEGLWVFSITLTSKLFFVQVRGRQIRLVFVPLVFSIGLEFLQLLHITHGRFDFWDIEASLLFWAGANYLVPNKTTPQSLLQPYNFNSSVCLSSYMIVYLAHV